MARRSTASSARTLNRPIGDLMPALSTALTSASPGTRGGALSVITARCGFPTMLSSPLKETYPADVARLRELASPVEQLLTGVARTGATRSLQGLRLPDEHARRNRLAHGQRHHRQISSKLPQ